MKEKSYATSDPTGHVVRKHAMLLDTDSRPKPDASVPAIAYAGADKVKKRNPKGQRVTRRPASMTLDWVAEMRAIRDRQSQEAFRALFEHFAPRVKAFLMKGGSGSTLAEDVTQEVMATVWRKAHLFDPTRASVSTWIFTIARNRKIDVIRKERRPEPEDLPWGPEAEPDQAEAIALQQETTKLGAAIAALPEKQRELIQRAYFGELSHSEIAAETGLPLGTIKSRIRLALERLRHAMG